VRARHVYHLFTVRHAARDRLQQALTDLGVGTAVHYPIPVPGQPLFGIDGEHRWPEAWRAAREVLSLPCFAELTDDEVERVADGVRVACERVSAESEGRDRGPIHEKEART
jgi:dTDP-4-amino-4,6-dideoxygalactose transaminase